MSTVFVFSIFTSFFSYVFYVFYFLFPYLSFFIIYTYNFVIHIHFLSFLFFLSFSFTLNPLTYFYVWRTAGTMWGSLIYVYTSGGYTACYCLNYERRQSFRPRMWKLTFLILLFYSKFLEILNLYIKLINFLMFFILFLIFFIRYNAYITK